MRALVILFLLGSVKYGTFNMCFLIRYLHPIASPAAIFYLLLMASPIIAEEITAREVAELYKASVFSIKNVKAIITIVSEREELLLSSNVEKATDGRAIYYFGDRLWEAGSERQRVEQRLLRRFKGNYVYDFTILGYDGREFRQYVPSAAASNRRKAGGIIKPFDGQTRDVFWIPEMLGYFHKHGPWKHLWEVLDEATIVPRDKIEAEEYEIVLEAHYTINEVNPIKLLVWFDENHGYLPVRFKTFREKYFDAIDSEMTVSQFHEVQPGIWVPVKARFTDYYMKASYPKGTDESDFKGKSAEEHWEMGFRYISVPLGSVDGGFYPDETIIDIHSLKVNTAVTDEMFAINFPEDLEVYSLLELNETELLSKAESKITGPSSVDSIVNNSNRSKFYFLVAVNILILLSFLVFYLYKKRAKVE